MLGAASMTGAPALALPKINSLVGRIFNPTLSASPLWSTSAKIVTAFVSRIALTLVHRVITG
jgi:hypothetical protein